MNHATPEWPIARELAALLYLCAAGLSFSATADPLPWQERVEANWIAQEYADVRTRFTQALSTQEDAAGGCDGVINGEWGFHTDASNNPWWQVDLGRLERVSNIAVWNRCQASERAARIKVLFSDDAVNWRLIYQHDGTVFYGYSDKKPLVVDAGGAQTRFVRVQAPGNNFLHLEEVEVFSAAQPRKNLALNRPANQSSISQWSRVHAIPRDPDWAMRTREVMALSKKRLQELQGDGLDLAGLSHEWNSLNSRLASLQNTAVSTNEFIEAKRIQRQLALKNPLLDFDKILFTKKVPGSFNHMSDQYYGWFSKPGGGIYILSGFKSSRPAETCLTTTFKPQGSFLRPTLSYDARKVLFAWCRFYSHLANEANKLDKANVPEDAFYHLFEMNIDGTGVRQLTRGKYDDFDGRYLPDGRIVFLSTRRGQFIQAGRWSASCTEDRKDLPDIYVRCGGGPERPVAVYTLHTMNSDGSSITAISPFEMFEWTPEINHDGTILHSRWDYIDRDNMPYMGLWSLNPDGSNPRVIFGNYTKAPHCVFEPKPIPNSRKIVFTASAHHAQTMGSLVLLDPSAGTEGQAPMKRLTPEIPFPEIEEWPQTYYASPWPLSERFYLVSWGYEGSTAPGPAGWNRWHAVQRPDNGMNLYLFDADMGRELLYADPSIASIEPMPVKPRSRPPEIASGLFSDKPLHGQFLVANAYHGLKTVRQGEIKALRIIAVPPKTHPTMDYPSIGITRDDPGKCVLGTVPVEEDGSAHFYAPSGVIVFFQALDSRGVALQTMKSVTHVQPGQTLGCAGCHEDRNTAAPSRKTIASMRPPSRIKTGPEGSWPLRFDRLVQPVLDKHCVSCHKPGSGHKQAERWNLQAGNAYKTLVEFGKPSLSEQVWAGYRRGFSIERDGVADRSRLLALLSDAQSPCKADLDSKAMERLIIWMDAYAQNRGSFSEEQEHQLEKLKESWVGILELDSDRTASK